MKQSVRFLMLMVLKYVSFGVGMALLSMVTISYLRDIINPSVQPISSKYAEKAKHQPKVNITKLEFQEKTDSFLEHPYKNTGELTIQSLKLGSRNICWTDLSPYPQKEIAGIPINIIEETRLFGRALTDSARAYMRELLSDELTFDGLDSIYPIPLHLILFEPEGDLRIGYGIESDSPDHYYYQYMLEGYDKQWQPITKSREASYPTNLPYGKYTFKVRVQGKDGGWCKPVTYNYETQWQYGTNFKAEFFSYSNILSVVIGVIVTLLLLFYDLYKYNKRFEERMKLEKEVVEKTADIAMEKKKSEDLLLNILPAEVAEELKEKGESKAQHHEDVSVLFTDFVNFTGISETLLPKELVAELHECFTAFDGIIEKNGLEKIKTIGDAYMAVCGLPQADPHHAQKTVQAALEIRDYIAHRKNNGGLFNIKIGVNSGPLVAGIVGVKKFAYDVWGDTVNTAARMEQNGEAGKVNISGATYELIKNDFTCEHRGKVAAKNKGEVDMYFVEGRRS